MPTYIFRNRFNKEIRGSVSATSEQKLFDKIDEQADPFYFEYCKTGQKTFWLDDEPTWSMFEPLQFDDSTTPHKLIIATDVCKEIIPSLLEKLMELKFDDYTCFVMARKDLENGNLESAISRIKVDIDKLICLDNKLYKYISEYLIPRFKKLTHY